MPAANSACIHLLIRNRKGGDLTIRAIEFIPSSFPVYEYAMDSNNSGGFAPRRVR